MDTTVNVPLSVSANDFGSWKGLDECLEKLRSTEGIHGSPRKKDGLGRSSRVVASGQFESVKNAFPKEALESTPIQCDEIQRIRTMLSVASNDDMIVSFFTERRSHPTPDRGRTPISGLMVGWS